MKPLVKWVGGKTRLLPMINQIIGTRRVTNYYEPCFGGGALFFDIHERIEGMAFLNDINQDLMEMYRAVRDAPARVCMHLESMIACDRTYISIKKEFNDHEDSGTERRAALLLGLLYLGFNGLYRVNKRKGLFNVPEGKDSNGKPRVLANFKFERIMEASVALCSAVLTHVPLNDTAWMGSIEGTDLFFYDPPYLNTFKGYDKSSFGLAEHIELLNQAHSHAARGALVICCGSNDPDTWSIYGKPTRVVGLERTVGASLRNRTTEALYVYGA